MEIFNFDYNSDKTNIKSLKNINKNLNYNSVEDRPAESIENEPGNIDKRMTFMTFVSSSPSAVIDADIIRAKNQSKQENKRISILVWKKEVSSAH